ncbi:ABC transporter ATP-binding protein [Mycolicibacterium sp. S2-37]|uniref:ABC transporter ATP-binding protein n=1 Tax=Mycolicibacterium sp. S2-37 TaxID=2810297 RepID=UPI001A942CAF|nr:ABC transporter ATP-binding protein [Mycolicibacterium sp. S2-37]MBO0680454.1 ABC transporter ATP-binding protein [Mycolicibacterium sp. S2-37]
MTVYGSAIREVSMHAHAPNERCDVLLRAHNLVIRTPAVPIVDSVSLTLSPGERLGIVGETGSGKSITCRAVLGALQRKGMTATGELRYRDMDLLTLDDRQWRTIRGREIGFIPQSSLNSLNPVMRVGQQLTETVRLFGVSKKNAGRRAEELMAAVQMPDPKGVLAKYPHELSGGMRQRVMIALGIAGEPRLLVADEPTTALDVTVQRRLLELLTDLCSSTGMALILVTHDLGIVSDVCDSVLVMYAGQSMESGPTETLFGRSRHPYTAALMQARPSMAASADTRLTGLPGRPPAVGAWPNGCRFADRCPLVIEPCRTAPPMIDEVEPGHHVRCIRAEGEFDA